MTTGKLPRKDELLKQSQESKTDSKQGATDNSASTKAKEEADIAIQMDKKAEAEIRTKLRQEGYNSLEEKERIIETRLQEIESMVQDAQRAKAEADKITEEAGVEKQKVLNAFQIVKQREAAVNARLEKAMKLEAEYKNWGSRYTAIRAELTSLITYHGANIKPCVIALRWILKTLYNHMDILNSETKYDFTGLYNAVLKKTNIIDKYVENIPKAISEDILPEEESPR